MTISGRYLPLLLAILLTVPACDPPEQPNNQSVTPGTDPGTDPGTNPGTDPGTNPGTDPGTNPGTDPTPTYTFALEGDVTQVVYPFYEARHYIGVHTDYPKWTVQSNQPWCKASNNETELEIALEEYNAEGLGASWRTATVQCFIGTNVVATLSVIQDPISYVDWGIQQLDFSPSGGTQVLTIFTNSYGWELAIYTRTGDTPAWFTAERTGDKEVTVTASAWDINTPKPVQAQLVLKTETAYASIEVCYKDPSLDSGEPINYDDNPTEWD